MRRFAQIALLACLSALGGAALAFDNGQYENVPPEIRTGQRRQAHQQGDLREPSHPILHSAAFALSSRTN